MEEPSPLMRTRAVDHFVVPALEVGYVVARTRRMITRGRRIPGLSLLLVATARGRVKGVTPHVPVLPWGVGLSPAWLMGWAARAERHAPESTTASGKAGAAALRGHADGAADRRRPLTREVGAGAAASSLALVPGISLGASVRGPSLAPSVLPGLTSRSSIGRSIEGGWRFAWNVDAARPALAISRSTAPRPARSQGPALTVRARESSAATRDGGDGDADVLDRRSLEKASERTDHGAQPIPIWAAPPIARSGLAAAARDTATRPRLPRRDPRATPAAMKDFVELTDALQTFVAHEVQEVKDAVAHAASRRPEPSPKLDMTPTEDVVRKLLSSMRSMMRDERFRSGKLR